MKQFKFSMFLFIFIIFSFIFVIPSYSLWNYREVNEAVVQIYRPDSGAGTGFGVKQGDRNFLVTNAHMLNGVDHVNVVAYIFNEGQTEPGKVEFDLQLIDKNTTILWKSLPNIDLGVIPLLEFILPKKVVASRVVAVKLRAGLRTFNYSQLATNSIITSEHIEPGNFVRAIGFPNNLSYGDIENYPILLAGSLSSDIVNDTINSPTFGKTKNTFIVNFFGSKGSSGSPVLSWGEDRMLNQPGVFSFNSITYIIGVIYKGPEINPYGFTGVLKVSSTGQTTEYRPPDDTTARLIVPIQTPYIGLTYVIPAKYIRELIDLFP